MYDIDPRMLLSQARSSNGSSAPVEKTWLYKLCHLLCPQELLTAPQEERLGHESRTRFEQVISNQNGIMPFG